MLIVSRKIVEYQTLIMLKFANSDIFAVQHLTIDSSRLDYLYLMK